jgi:hypothetical protein
VTWLIDGCRAYDAELIAEAEAEQEAEYAAQVEEMLAAGARYEDDRAHRNAPQPAREARR